MNEREIFTDALRKLYPFERATYLAEACGDDAALRERVEALLREHEQLGSFLEAPATAPAPSPTGGYSGAERPGTTIGPYKLLQQIGEGGMGTVFMAEQTRPVKRTVALKIIKSGLDGRQVIARFEAERQALALMDHPNIARVLDVGTTEQGRPYFVMELVKGVPITKYCDEHHLTPKQRLELLVPVCQAVQHAHQKGIIHRDLKPSNVLVAEYDDKPVPKVIDFGVAKATGPRLTERTQFTEFGQVVGTVEYMSPEQAKLNALDIDTRSDIYSLGVLSYELLTGTTPFEKKRLYQAAFDEILRIIREEDPPKPSTRLSTTEELASIAANRGVEPKKLNGLVRGELDWIVMKCLEKDRNRRYETANGLAMDLLRFLHDEPVEASPPSRGYRLRKFLVRHRRPMVAALVVFLVLVGGIIGTFCGLVEARRQRDEADRAWAEESMQRRDAIEQGNRALQAEKLAREEANNAKKHAGEARANLYVAHMNLAQAAWEGGHLTRVSELLDLYRAPAGGQPDLRGWEWRHLERLCHGELRTLIGHTNGASAPAFRGVAAVAFSPDGKFLASAGWDDYTVRLWDAASGREMRTLKGHKFRATGVAFSPDGKRLASTGWDSTVRLWDVAAGKELRTLRRPNAGVGNYAFNSATFSSDGKVLATACSDGKAWLWNTESGQVIRTFPCNWQVMSVALSPDGKLLAGAPDNPNERVKIWDAQNGLELRSLKGHSSRVECVAFSPDGIRLASASLDGTLKVWDASSGKELQTLVGHTAGVISVAFSPDGARLASASADRTVKFWDASSGQEIGTLVGHTDRVACVTFSPDGARLASASWDGMIKLWGAISSPEPRPLKGHAATVRSVAFSPHEDRLASAGDDKTIRLWDAASSQELRILRGHSNPVESVTFSPDGTRLVSAAVGGLKIWDTGIGQELRALPASGVVAFTKDGKRLASARQNGVVEIWDAVSGQVLHTLRHKGPAAYSVAFSPDGTLLASGGITYVQLWDTGTGKPLHTLSGQPKLIKSVAFSPDGALLASGSLDGTVKLWEPAGGKEIRTLKAHTSGVLSVAFSPDGTRLASGGNDKTIKIWNVASGEDLRTLKGHTEPVLSVAFSRDGGWLASAGKDGLKLWDARPLSAAVSAELEARSLVEFLRSKALTKAEALSNLHGNSTIDEPVRRKALEFVDVYWQGSTTAQEFIP